MTNNDIVALLRDCTCVPHGEICRNAADEIERLRKRLLVEENAYDILRRENEHLQTDRNNLALEIERLRKRLRQENATLTAERDEARREVCQLMRPDEYNEPFDGTVFEYAAHRGWDCFKEASDERHC